MGTHGNEGNKVHLTHYTESARHPSSSPLWAFSHAHNKTSRAVAGEGEPTPDSPCACHEIACTGTRIWTRCFSIARVRPLRATSHLEYSSQSGKRVLWKN